MCLHEPVLARPKFGFFPCSQISKLFGATNILQGDPEGKEMGGYLVLRMRFSEVSTVGDLPTAFSDYLRAGLLNDAIDIDPENCSSTLHHLFSTVHLSGQKMYLIVDVGCCCRSIPAVLTCVNRRSKPRSNRHIG